MAIYTALINITILLLFTIWTSVTNATIEFRGEVQQRKRDCVTAVGTGGTCESLLQCLQNSGGSRLPVRPSLCWWEVNEPVICCPKSGTLACGLSDQRSAKVKRQTSFEGGDGTTDKTVDGFIIGGKNALPGKWPWMGLIFLEEDVKRLTPLCGATLISDQTLLTAAHCFVGRRDGNFVIRLGEHNIADRGNGRPTEIKVAKVISHEEFQYPSLYNDIAILQLEKKVKFSNRIITVCLPEELKTENFVGKNVIVTGWGLLGFGGKQAKILQELEMPVISNENCQTKYDTLSGIKVSLPQGITSTVMCAGYEQEAKDACQGDSGGPLVFQQPSGNWVQVGIVSAGFDCGSGIPGLYTRVTSYLDWIKKNTV